MLFNEKNRKTCCQLLNFYNFTALYKRVSGQNVPDTYYVW